MMDLEGYESLKNYFSTIAKEHKLLGDGADKAFIFGDEGVAVNNGRSWVGIKLWLDEPEPAGLTNSNSDNYLLKRKVTLFVGGAAPNGYAEEQTRFKTCEGIVIDIASRMIGDVNNFDIIIDVPSIRFGRVNSEFMPGGTKFTGCRMDFTYTDPSGFTYNTENWNIPEEED